MSAEKLFDQWDPMAAYERQLAGNGRYDFGVLSLQFGDRHVLAGGGSWNGLSDLQPSRDLHGADSILEPGNADSTTISEARTGLGHGYGGAAGDVWSDRHGGGLRVVLLYAAGSTGGGGCG